MMICAAFNLDRITRIRLTPELAANVPLWHGVVFPGGLGADLGNPSG
jgi:hypothetical protein